MKLLDDECVAAIARADDGPEPRDWPADNINRFARFDIGACDALNVPIWFCRPNGELVCASRVARVEVETQNTLMVANGRLVAADESSNAALQPAIRCAGESRSSVVASLLLRRRETGTLDRVDIGRMPPDHDSGAESIVVVAMMRQVSPRLRELLPSIDLTKAEAEVADLTAGGLSCPDIARQRNVTVATVRSQLAVAYQKLGARNRVDLINILLGRRV
jgi:DNA-binding CsgD family transcriptional regulator/small nuclear ribonucleoprotein (snRNP)-like protein